jgi:hypothetical protein
MFTLTSTYRSLRESYDRVVADYTDVMLELEELTTENDSIGSELYALINKCEAERTSNLERIDKIRRDHRNFCEASAIRAENKNLKVTSMAQESVDIALTKVTMISLENHELREKIKELRK